MEALISKTVSETSDIRDDGAFVFHHPPKFLWDRDSTDLQAPLKWGNYHFYIHVPFCRKICTFCTFERRQLHKGAVDWFFELLNREMDIFQKFDDFEQANIESVYLGGGTASLLTVEMIGHIITRLSNEFGLKDLKTEITLESEPGTKKIGELQAIRKLGVNRISIGLQAFEDEQLKILNRSHSVKQAVDMIDAAKQVGFENLHIDIMYGLPGQTLAQWKNTVNRVIDMRPTHISAYPLIVFPGELLDRKMKSNNIPGRPSVDIINEMREYAAHQFKQAGLLQYSTAEFSIPEYQCRYVKSTWDASDYLGMGPGAYSRHHNLLWEDDVIHPGYERRIRLGEKPIGKQYNMSPQQQLQRDIAMGLCLLEIDLDVLESKAGARSEENIINAIDVLQSQKLVSRYGSRITLTDLGSRYATHVMKSFTDL